MKIGMQLRIGPLLTALRAAEHEMLQAASLADIERIAGPVASAMPARNGRSGRSKNPGEQR